MFLLKSGRVYLMNPNNTIMEVSKYYERQGGRKLKSVILQLNSDEMQTVTPPFKCYGYFFYSIKLFFLNSLDLFKAVVKKRKYNHITSCVHETFIPGDIFYNIHNGTVVIIKENDVDKFYFKDHLYFFNLYKSLQIKELYAHVYNNFSVINMKKYTEFNSSLRPLDFKALNNQIAKLSQSALQVNKEYLSPKFKIKQIFHFYKQNSNHKVNSYSSWADKVRKRVTPGTEGICHGDLWASNIMRGEQGVELIDFDKALLFCKEYDLVYFYLMTNVFNSKWSASDIFINMQSYIGEIISYYENNLVQLKDENNLKQSITLILIIKLTEYDLRHNELGNNLSVFEKFI